MLDRQRQRLQSLLFHLHRDAATAWTHRLVVVVEQILIDGARQRGFEFGRAATSLFGLLENRLAAVLQLRQRVQALGHCDQPVLIEVAGLVATVAGQESGGGVLFE